MASIEIRIRMGRNVRSPKEGLGLFGVLQSTFSVKKNTKENAVISCLFYPSLVLSVGTVLTEKR